MKGIRPALIRAETVRQIDIVLESLADGRLDRVALRKLPPWRAALLARVARRAGVMPQHELDALTAEVIRVGVDGSLEALPEPEELPDPLPRPYPLRIPSLASAPRQIRQRPVPADAPEWTQSGMIKKSVGRQHPGSRHPAVRDSTG